MFAQLKPLNERKLSSDEVIARIEDVILGLPVGVEKEAGRECEQDQGHEQAVDRGGER